MAVCVQKDDLLSDEEWLVSRARLCIKSDPCGAKSWMITARSLFPQHFEIQFEAYSLEKIGRNVKEAAKLLEEMFLTFPNETRLWTEVQSILEALQSESSNSFLTEIFAALTTPTQCQMLISLSNKMTDILEQCRLLLLAMRKFTSLVNEHGLKLVGTLQKAEWDANMKSPVNCYRKFLVCDVLPLVLQKKKKFELPTSQFHNWLQLAVEFYVMYITQPPIVPASSPLTPDILSPTKLSRQASISGLLDKECQIPDPWENLQKLVIQIGHHLGWDIDKLFFSQTRDIQCQQILSLHHRSQQVKTGNNTKQVLFTTVVVFLESLYSYVSSVDPDSFIGSLSSSEPLILVEGFKFESTERPSPSKKLKSVIAPPILSPPCVPKSKTVTQCFTTAFKCYELLYSTAELQREFQVLCKAWKLETWTWMSHFQTDMLLFQGAYNEAVEHLHSFSSTMRDKMKIRSNLQMACCYHCLGNYPKVCELVLDTISGLQDSNQSNITDQSQINVPEGCSRHLVLTLCKESEIFPYCIKLLVSSLKEKILSGKCDDMALGHMIILLQYDWPKHTDLFHQMMQKIKAQGSLTYNFFFNYVINIDILEELALLKSTEGGKVSLDILPTSTKIIAQQRTVTRGVNKGVKEDFKMTIEKQVKRCEENVYQLVRTFLIEEKLLLIESLTK